MQTLGSTIKEIRESKKLSIQDISAKTNIIAEYIEAIENDNFGVLPAEVYVKGFLQNISRVLDIDPNKILLLYKNRDTDINALENAQLLEEYTKPIIQTKTEKSSSKLKNINKKTKKKKSDIDSGEIGSAKIELEYSKREQELLLSASSMPKSKRMTKIRYSKIVVIPIILVLLIGLVVVILPRIKGATLSNSNEIETENNAQINIVDSYTKIGVKKGDIIHFKPANDLAILEFKKIDGNVEATLNGFDVTFLKTTPFMADINKNGIDDFRLQIVDIVDNVAMIEIEQIAEVQDETASNNIFNNADSSYDDVATVLDSNIQVIDGDMYILRNVEQSSITVEATAKRFVYVRYFVDNLKPITTNLSSGNSISITAEEVIMLTIGNASEIVLKVNGKSVVFGNAGETVNKTIKWIKNLDNSTKFDLVVTDTK